MEAAAASLTFDQNQPRINDYRPHGIVPLEKAPLVPIAFEGSFSIGLPTEFPPQTATFLADRRLFVFNSPEGFYAISSVCTHLGCNVKRAGQGFACPCHGSRFDDNGLVTRGPAPAPLAWYALALSPRGDLIVDLDRKVAPDFRLRA